MLLLSFNSAYVGPDAVYFECVSDLQHNCHAYIYSACFYFRFDILLS